MTFNVNTYPSGLMTRGRLGSMVSVTGGNATLADTVKAVVVCSSGNVKYRAKNESSSVITMTGLPAGAVLPHVPGVILATGLTATLATVED